MQREHGGVLLIDIWYIPGYLYIVGSLGRPKSERTFSIFDPASRVTDDKEIDIIKHKVMLDAGHMYAHIALFQLAAYIPG